MADVQSHREINEGNTNSLSGTAAPTEQAGFGDSLGPNPYEDAYAASHEDYQPQSEGSDEPEAGIVEATAPASDGDDAEILPGSEEADDQVAEPEQPPTQTDSPEMTLLRQQHAELQARIDRMEAASEPEQAAVEQGIVWDGLELAEAPEELADYDEFLTKRMTQIADHVWGHAQRQADAHAAQVAAQESQEALKIQAQEMIDDPAYADVDRVFPEMKALMAKPVYRDLLTQRNGLKALYVAAGGVVAGAGSRSVNTDPATANAAKAQIANTASRRASAVDQPKPTPTNTSRVATPGRSLSQAMAEEFAAAKEDARRRA